MLWGFGAGAVEWHPEEHSPLKAEGELKQGFLGKAEIQCPFSWCYLYWSNLETQRLPWKEPVLITPGGIRGYKAKV